MSKRLFIGNLAWSTTEDSLRAALEEGGRNCANVRIIMDRETGRPRGFAFAEMETPEEAKAAIEELNGKELDGRPLRVNEAEERPPRPGGGGGFGGGGGGYRGGGGRPRRGGYRGGAPRGGGGYGGGGGGGFGGGGDGGGWKNKGRGGRGRDKWDNAGESPGGGGGGGGDDWGDDW